MTSSLLPTYARTPLAFARGEGVWLETADGNRYLDLGGGIAVASLGYAHPHLVAALTDQAGRIWHTSNLFEIPQAERLAQRLCAASFADYVFLTNSGAEALEGAIKTARKYHSASPAIPNGSTSSPSRAPSTGARWRRSRRAATTSTSRASGRRRRGSTRSPGATWRR